MLTRGDSVGDIVTCGGPLLRPDYPRLKGKSWLATARRQLLPWLHQLFFSHPPPLTPITIIAALARALRVACAGRTTVVN